MKYGIIDTSNETPKVIRGNVKTPKVITGKVMG
jgi:hypothetical protein